MGLWGHTSSGFTRETRSVRSWARGRPSVTLPPWTRTQKAVSVLLTLAGLRWPFDSMTLNGIKMAIQKITCSLAMRWSSKRKTSSERRPPPSVAMAVTITNVTMLMQENMLTWPRWLHPYRFAESNVCLCLRVVFFLLYSSLFCLWVYSITVFSLFPSSALCEWHGVIIMTFTCVMSPLEPICLVHIKKHLQGFLYPPSPQTPFALTARQIRDVVLFTLHVTPLWSVLCVCAL